MSVVKNEILWRLYGVFAVFAIAAAFVFIQTVRVSVVEGPALREKGKELHHDTVYTQPSRGNIIAADGSLLATSLPLYDIAFDPNSSAMDSLDFYANIDSLALCIANFADNSRTTGGWRDYLLKQRWSGDSYVRIKRNASYTEMERISNFPLFRMGQFRGGLIVEKKYNRQRPFKRLAQRTIGYVRDDIQPVGLEGQFNEVLEGEPGRQLVVHKSGGASIPIGNLAKIEPISGNDIKTTIDVNIQDIAERALHKAVQHHQAKFGVAIVMEVETGAIRAIANLSEYNGAYEESYNHGIGTAVEPGSIFKTASVLAMLEDGYLNLNDTIDLQKGKMKFYEEELVDSSPHGIDSTSVAHAFSISSNVGIAQLVQKYYGDTKKGGKFIKKLHQFMLDTKTGIELEGEAPSRIKKAYSVEDQWSGTTLPWMAIGYELLVTPIQMLTFYNAIANNGRMMKPYLVSEKQRFGQTLELYRPTALKRKIAGTSSIRKVQVLLEDVVENGTASRMKSEHYRYAGKTGTTQINYRKFGDQRDVGGYQASFVGYFPAEAPKYTCIVLVSGMRSGVYYGSDVALPVFREIADKLHASRIELHRPYNEKSVAVYTNARLPGYDAGWKDDMDALVDYLHLPVVDQGEEHLWAMLRPQNDTLKMLPRELIDDRVPNVVGMGLRDALYVLENRGIKVKISGYGRVVRQSIIPGTKVRGQIIRLNLG